MTNLWQKHDTGRLYDILTVLSIVLLSSLMMAGCLVDGYQPAVFIFRGRWWWSQYGHPQCLYANLSYANFNVGWCTQQLWFAALRLYRFVSNIQEFLYTCKVQQTNLYINFNVTYFSILRKVIMNITIILYPLCARTDLFHSTLSVKRYS